VQINRSNIVPHLFGGLMLEVAAGYLLESFGNFTIPGNEVWLALLVGITAALGEVGLTFYIMIKGRKSPETPMITTNA